MGFLRPVTSSMLLATVGLDGFREVPHGYWTERRDAKGEIKCPCGHRPVVAKGELQSCRDRAASPHRCSRQFLFLGTKMLVAGGPKA